MRLTMNSALLLLCALPAVAMEPAVVTSAPAAPTAAADTSTPTAVAPPTAAQAASSLEPAVQTSTAAASPAQDRLELETTQITGNRELPRVLYVVPWKRPDLGELAGRPATSLLDEVLAPVDRDVFRRQNRYYEALKPDSPATVGAAGTEGEK